MAFCLDTDHLVEFFRGNKTVVLRVQEKIRTGEDIFITSISLCELFRGAYLSRNPDQEVLRIKILIYSCRILDFTVEATEIFGKISAKLSKKGMPIGDADLLIGCIALAHNCSIVTNNVKHFERIEGLTVDNWVGR